MAHHFFAYMARMKLIQRWPLMRNVQAENVAEHSLQVAMVAHVLAVLRNKKFGGDVDVGEVTALALYHDASEVLTGDLPTPVKYFNPQITEEYRRIEHAAEEKLLSYLPHELQSEFELLLVGEKQNADAKALVKAADSICAYLKCMEEQTAGNKEFAQAKLRLATMIDERNCPEVSYFMTHFVPGFELTLDQLSKE